MLPFFEPLKLVSHLYPESLRVLDRLLVGLLIFSKTLYVGLPTQGKRWLEFPSLIHYRIECLLLRH